MMTQKQQFQTLKKDFVDINSTKTDVDEFWNTFKEQCTTFTDSILPSKIDNKPLQLALDQ